MVHAARAVAGVQPSLTMCAAAGVAQQQQPPAQQPTAEGACDDGQYATLADDVRCDRYSTTAAASDSSSRGAHRCEYCRCARSLTLRAVGGVTAVGRSSCRWRATLADDVRCDRYSTTAAASDSSSRGAHRCKCCRCARSLRGCRWCDCCRQVQLSLAK